MAPRFHCADGWIRDEHERVRIFRGANLSGRAKLPPFVALEDHGALDPLAAWGWNAVRLLVLWEGVAPQRGVIDDDYVKRTIEREKLSSTAFTDALAVPHALGMTATRTSIAIGIADPSIPWGEGRVQVVALVAFSETDREAFQTVFEQFVEVFSERDSVQRIVRRAADFSGFLDELVAVIDG